MARIADGDKWIFLEFTNAQGKTGLVQLNAHFTGSDLSDVSEAVARLLVQKIQATSGWTLTKATVQVEVHSDLTGI